ncbi:unnamed protein product [Amaranthus hypochondriacus]
MNPFFVLGLLLVVNLLQSEAHNVGICYKPGKNEASPSEVIALIEKHKIPRIRLYEPNQETMKALKGRDIEVMLGVPNAEIIPLSLDPTGAELWVRTNIKAYFPDLKIKYLVVGDAISANNDNNGKSYFLLDTLNNFQKALSKEGMNHIKLTSSFDVSTLKNPYNDPPSNVSFVFETQEFIDPILKLLSDNNSPILVDIYPYYGRILNPNMLSLDSALFKGTDENLLCRLMDDMYSALEKGGYKSFDIVVAETGWPSAGGVDASVENQKTYITNLIQNVKKGCPKRPTKPIDTYLFTLFDEDVQEAPEIERHFGLFTPNKELKFELVGGFNS